MPRRPAPTHRFRSPRAMLGLVLLTSCVAAGAADAPAASPTPIEAAPLLALAPIQDASEIRPIREPRLVVVRLPLKGEAERGEDGVPALGSTFAVLVALIAWIALKRA